MYKIGIRNIGLLKIISIVILFQACRTDETKENQNETITIGFIGGNADPKFLLSDSISILRWPANELYKILTVTKKNNILLKDTFSSGLGFEEVDFNRDGFKDLIIIELGGNHGTYFLYLWDKFQNRYHEIEDYRICPHSIPLKPNLNLFYNVDIAGCYGDHKSYLWKLEDFKIVPIAYIYIQDCVSDESRDDHYMEIRTSSYLDSMENGKLIERIDIIPDGTYEEIIKKYWNKNYEKLIK